MKKVVLLIGIILFMNLVSAGYSCSEGLMDENQKEIDLYDRTSINGLGLGLTYSDETAAFERYSVKLIIDAVKFTLTNETNSTEVEMKSGTDTITLLNLTSTLIKIKVDDDSEEVEVQEISEINNRKIFLVSASGTYPGTATVIGIIGNDEISIDNAAPTKVVTIEDIDYLLGLFSASDNNAIINVKKCKNESARIIGFEDEIIENITIENNETVEEDMNETSNETESEVNTLNGTSETLEGENLESKTSDKKTPLFGTVILFILIAIVLGGILILSIVLFKNVKRENEIQVAQPDI